MSVRWNKQAPPRLFFILCLKRKSTQWRLNAASVRRHILSTSQRPSARLGSQLSPASIAVPLGGWLSYARRITEAGADALELNIYKIPTRDDVPGSTIENIYIDIVRSVRATTKIPLAVKLSPYFSSFANIAAGLDALNVDGLVLFNRFYQPDIDLEKMEVVPNLTLSTPADMRLPLHWIGILYGKIRANLAATTGIYQAHDVVKLVMAGADVTMLCSALMRHGITHIQRIEMDLAAWLEQHGHSSLRELKGVMSQKNCPDPSAFERAQYVRGLSSYTSLFPMRR